MASFVLSYNSACIFRGSHACKKGTPYFYDAPMFVEYLPENDTTAGREAERDSTFQLVAVV